MNIVSILVIALLFAAASFGESGQGRPRGGMRQPAPSQRAPEQIVLPSFTGVLQSATNKKLYLSTGQENAMEFYVTGKTTVLDGDKKLKVKQLSAGQRIAVEAKQYPDSSLEAVRITIVHETPQPEKEP